MSHNILPPRGMQRLIGAGAEATCHHCGTEANLELDSRHVRVLPIGWSWNIEYLDDGASAWRCHCPDCVHRASLEHAPFPF